MRRDQRIVVGGTLNGERVTSGPLMANVAIMRFRDLRAQGYSQLTMTDADTGVDYNVGGLFAENPKAKQ